MSLRFAGKSVQSTTKYATSIPTGSTVFSLIQPTGRIHLGNYLGAINSWKHLSLLESEGTKFIFGTADLHAVTIPFDAKKLKQYRFEAIVSLLASGLDPKKCIIYHQSLVPEHTELNWYLTCVTPMGALHRMTQWKLKLAQALKSGVKPGQDVNSELSSSLELFFENTKAGLLSYPILQASDVLLYHSTHVPVGDDQSQHLELCRDIASSFNHTHGVQLFPKPNTLLTPTNKVLSLRNPLKKMSKSDLDQNSCIYINDTPDAIRSKVRKSVTDSIQGPITYDPVNRPGVSNMVNVLAGLNNQTVEETMVSIEHINDHKLLKDYFASSLIELLEGKRKMYERLMGEAAYVDEICKDGTQRAREIASVNIKKVREVMGLD